MISLPTPKARLILILFAFASNSVLADEEILSFDSQVSVSKQGDLTVQETILVTAEGEQIKRGLVRKLPSEYKRKHSLATLFGGHKPQQEDQQFTIKEVFIDGKRSFDWQIDKRAYGEYLKFHDFFLAGLQRPSVLLTVTYQAKGTDDEFNRHDFEDQVSVYALERGLYIDYFQGYRKQNILSHFLGRLWHGHFFSLNDPQKLEIQSVLKDGKYTPWFIKKEHGYEVIYIGSRNVFLEPGEYQYTIDYRYGRQSWRDDNKDKISWNVTGNGWPFTIQKASTTIQFPDEINSDEVEVAAFTGYVGQIDKAFTVDQLSDNQVRISTNQTLAPRQGITVDLSWSEGSINQIGVFSKISDTVRANKGLFALFAAWLGGLLIYWLTWWKHGRDPSLKQAIPQYQAPNGVSPAVMRFVNQEGEYDDRVFGSALVSLASKGMIKIEETANRTYKLHKLGDSWDDDISNDEHFLFKSLFKKRKLIDPDKPAHAESLFRAQNAHTNFLNSKHESGKYLMKNSARRFGLWIIQFALWFATFLFTLHQGTFDSSFFVAFTLAYFLLCRFANGLVARRTKRGADWVPKMEGFFQYLMMAEKDELRAVHPLKKTPEVYQQYLPYAVALDIEDVWGEKFSDVLSESVRAALAAIFGSADLDFSNYTDSLNNHLNRRIDASRKTSERARAKARAERVRASGGSWGGSSSSGGGFSGGGSSGGGSGGGGGGGWMYESNDIIRYLEQRVA